MNNYWIGRQEGNIYTPIDDVHALSMAPKHEKNSKIVGGSAMRNLHIATQVLNALRQKDSPRLWICKACHVNHVLCESEDA